MHHATTVKVTDTAANCLSFKPTTLRGGAPISDDGGACVG